MRGTEMKGRSLPETPTSFMEQQHDRTSSLMPPRSVSTVSVDEQDLYTDLTESTEEPRAERPRTSFSDWRDQINGAGTDELRALLSNVVGTLENGLRTSERQSYHSPGNGCILVY